MARYPTFGMEQFESTMKECVNMLVESLGENQGRINIQLQANNDEARIIFTNPNAPSIVLVVKRDIDRVRFYLPVAPTYKSVDDISSDLYDELIYVRKPSTPEFIRPDRWFGEWKIEYESKDRCYYFCLVHDDVLTQLDEEYFERIFSGLWAECMWYYSNYQNM